ncbi:ycaO, ribosomal protein S12 methylthiotransferase accessory factor (plasmid) [Nostoc flagelliforme CCNUN1]|uniref:YcaO, ribosomal protein S12 methylthiotransferase accessory factor n=1 Tax=Nostoc flagelliforme CCNUN1 TaxID=2038116 RepID=A0A2K8T8P2_9NOSO|nr:TOMM precursor leader peptide-binding protein [Nostoc flagelliforme]AUB44064.1 ycaO, ribosomal protein S12 methylthiotransferase accessory factor [Nostoc flagelliforme CCNUN1]
MKAVNKNILNKILNKPRLHKPKFSPRFNVQTLELEGVFLVSEKDSFLLDDHFTFNTSNFLTSFLLKNLENPQQNLYQKLTNLIDGNHTVDEIVDKIVPQILAKEVNNWDIIYAHAKVYHALMQMEENGYIVESDNQLPSNLAIFCEYLNIEPKKAQTRLQTTQVAVKSFGSNLPTAEFKTILESLNIKVSDQGDIEVVLTDDYLQDGLESYNQEALHLSRHWMLVKPVGTVVWIGPIFHPGKTGCWKCLAQRLRNNRPVEEFIQKYQGISTPIIPPLYSLHTWQTTLGMVATEVLKWILLGENKRLENFLVTYDTFSLEIQNHVLVKRPQCPSCGKISSGFARNPQPIILKNQKKTFITDGGHRCCSPQETLNKYQHHISPITGVIRELKKIDQGANSLTHTYIAKHHFATMFDNLNSLRLNLSGRSAGKGKTDQQAQASGFCEAIERYSSVFQGDEIWEIGNYKQMGDKAIHPNACMNFSQEQYQNRVSWNASRSDWFQKVPEPFDEEREIKWTPVWSLTHKEFKYLPTAYCYHGYPELIKPDCWADTNGCAAGNTIEEAILQGFMELVERDCVALWWYNRIQRPSVDLDSFDEPYFQALKNYYQTIPRELWVLDITSDLNIPAFVAISRRTDREIEDIVLGFGAHFDAKLAIGRALTEVHQILPNVLFDDANATTQYPAFSDQLAIDWWKTAKLQNESYLASDESVSSKVRADYPQIWNEDLLEDIKTCQRIVEKHGMEMLVLDQTRPDIGLKVVKVIVPGLRHWWKRLGSGRLYEVPVKLGLLEEPLKENQLNPFPMWM